jgi:hypothetical protein
VIVDDFCWPCLDIGHVNYFQSLDRTETVNLLFVVKGHAHQLAINVISGAANSWLGGIEQ